MSAGLEQFDWMMSAKKRPWHGIGTVVEDAVGSADALRIAKLDWGSNTVSCFGKRKRNSWSVCKC